MSKPNSWPNENEEKRVAREKMLEKTVLDILKEDWHSDGEGWRGLSPEGLFIDMKRVIKDLSLKEFAETLNRLSGDGWQKSQNGWSRSRKRIKFDFISDDEILLADELKKRRIHINITPK